MEQENYIVCPSCFYPEEEDENSYPSCFYPEEEDEDSYPEEEDEDSYPEEEDEDSYRYIMCYQNTRFDEITEIYFDPKTRSIRTDYSDYSDEEYLESEYYCYHCWSRIKRVSLLIANEIFTEAFYTDKYATTPWNHIVNTDTLKFTLRPFIREAE